MQLSGDMPSAVKDILAPHLQHTTQDDRPIVMMTCGIAGSGKTTLAKAIQAAWPTFHRISCDEIIHQQHGLYGIDYDASPSFYAQYQAEMDEKYMSTFRTLLNEDKDIILERSFFAKQDRDEYRNIAQVAGAKVVLVFLRAEGESGKNLLWARICHRAKGTKTADSALDISKETFDMYWDGFETPVGEGEIVVEVQ